MPEEWLISRICEEFGCLPKRAIEAIEEDEGFLLFRILDFRAYAKAKQIYDSTPMDKRPNTPLIRLVSDITMELAKEKIEKYNKQQKEQ